MFLAKYGPADNKTGPVVADEELFATDVVTCVGQVRRLETFYFLDYR